MTPRIRMRIARLLDKLPGQCWTDLVCWAVRTRRLPGERRGPWSPITDACRADRAQNCACYCGKLQRGGEGQ